MALNSLLRRRSAAPALSQESDGVAGDWRRAALAGAFRRARERRELSQRQLADAVGVSQSLVSLIETPTRPLNVKRDRLLDLLRNGLELSYAEIDAFLWLAGKAPLSADEVRLLFGPTAAAVSRSSAQLEALARALTAPPRPSRAVRLGAGFQRWQRAATSSPRRLLAAAAALLLAGIVVGWGVATAAHSAQAARTRARAAEQLDIWGWIGYTQTGRPGAHLYDMASEQVTPLLPDLALSALSLCPTDRSRVAVIYSPADAPRVALWDLAARRPRWEATRAPAHPADLGWIEQCARLVYRSADQTLVAVRVADGAEEILTQLPADTVAATVAPTPHAWAWVAGDGQLSVQHAQGSPVVVGRADTTAAVPVWAPDGERLAWLGPVETGRRPLLLYSARTGQQRVSAQLDGSARLLTWSLSGRGLAFVARDGAASERIWIWAFPLQEAIPAVAVSGPAVSSLTWSCGHARPEPGASEPRLAPFYSSSAGE
jgi:transcriptional regulator with XRE-family HTH domain